MGQPKHLIIGITLVAAILQWHLLACNQLPERYPAPPGMSITINPITNAVFLHDDSAVTPMDRLGSALAITLAAPTVAQHFNERASERLDLYAMVIPYRVALQ